MMRNVAERFWEKVNKADGCWLWTANTMKNGYGQFSMPGHRCVSAHRMAWTLAKGQIPEGMNVLHRCDVRNCVNPEHLFIGTQGDNLKDMYAKKRNKNNQPHNKLRMEKKVNAKLSRDIVRTTRHLYFAERRQQREIAAFFGVSQATAWSAINGKTWRLEA